MRNKVRRSRIGGQSGMALITVMMVMMLISVLMVGFVAAIVSDSRASGLDRDQTQAYAASHAGLEKLTADLWSLVAGGSLAPTDTQVNALMSAPPAVPGFEYVDMALGGTAGSGYNVAFTADPVTGDPAPLSLLGTMIKAGPYQGFKGIITQYDITTTARSTGGAEVRMRRSLQTIIVPVFQFGMFSETDLAFHAGESFAFGGRVHTNGNLYLAEGDNEILTLSDRVTALGEVIRTHLPNGLLTTTGYNGRVRVPLTVSPLTPPPASTLRDLLRTEGSLTGTLGSAQNEPRWTNLSVGTYSSNIRNGRTGAKKLDLPLVSQGAVPIDLVRRPAQGSNEDTASPNVFRQRFFSKAAFRILLSDTAAEITSLPTVTATAPISLSTFGTAYYTGATPALAPPLAYSSAFPLVAEAGGTLAANIYKTTNESLIGGFIKVEMLRDTGAWEDVTQEILNLGIAGRSLTDSDVASPSAVAGWTSVPSGAADTCIEPNPNAVIRLQRVRDVPFLATGANPTVANRCGVTLVAGAVTAVSNRNTDYWPMALYDPREGHMRDNLVTTDLVTGGIIHYISLDVNNLRRWFLGAIGASGLNARSPFADENFIVYFSDRRNNKNVAGVETGEYGWEDVTNPASGPGTANGVLNAGEDLNGSGALDDYGRVSRNVGTGITPFGAADLNTTIINTAGTKPIIARANRTVWFRRALKIVNGAQGNISAEGLTIASENPVYLEGNFNATAASVTAGAHAATSIVADSVTLLSNAWNDIRSFTFPADSSQRRASTTGYRVAIVSGKGLAFQPAFAGASGSFGSDGGAHNFLRLLEDWATPVATLRYRGSLVSFFISRQATGTFKCCFSDTYVRGVREMAFDTDFLTPSLLPPGTPAFRDLNTLTFRQLLRPTQ